MGRRLGKMLDPEALESLDNGEPETISIEGAHLVVIHNSSSGDRLMHPREQTDWLSHELQVRHQETHTWF